MKRIAFILTMMVSLVAAQAQQVKHFTVQVGDFTKLKVADNIDVDYYANADSAGYVVFDCTSEMANCLILQNNDKGQFTIQVMEDNVKGQTPKLRVYSKTLAEACVEADSTLTINHLGTVPNLKVTLKDNGHIFVNNVTATAAELKIVTGKGTITATGKVTRLYSSITGTGRVYALDFPADEISVRIGGTGYLYCTSNGGKLKVKGIGSGKVYYKGTPSEVNVKKLGTIKALPYTGVE